MYLYLSQSRVGVLKAFSTPAWALLRTMVGITGDTGFDGTFLDASLSYPTTAMILFILFLVIMVILFNNMLVRSIVK